MMTTKEKKNGFKLRISPKQLQNDINGNISSWILRKYSVMQEPLSLALLRVHESGIPDQFRTVISPIDWNINPNQWTDYESAKKPITLNLAEVYFQFIVLCLSFTTFNFSVEKFIYPKVPRIKNLNAPLKKATLGCIGIFMGIMFGVTNLVFISHLIGSSETSNFG